MNVAKDSVGNLRYAFSLEEVAKLIGVSIGHLRNENRRGRISFFKCGRRTLILAKELEKYLNGFEFKKRPKVAKTKGILGGER